MMLAAAGPMLTRSAFWLLSSSSLTSFLSLVEFQHPHGVVSNNEEDTQRNSNVYSSTPSSSFWVGNAEYPQQQDDQSSHDNNDYNNDYEYALVAPAFRDYVASILDQDPTMAGPLVRLAFHDATTLERTPGQITGGPNGSIEYELDWSDNRALSKPLKLVQQARQRVVAHTNNNQHNTLHLSLADAIALAGATGVEHAGGPFIPIRLGRIDVDHADPYFLRQPLQMTTERSRVTSTMPSAGLDSDGLRLYFGQRLHLSQAEWVALSGIHGLGRHVTLLGMPKDCLRNLTRVCLEDAPKSLPFVTSSVDRFSNAYFQFLIQWFNRQVQLGDVAFIPTDVALVVDKGLRWHVQQFARNPTLFSKTFVRAYQKLVETTATSKLRY